MKKLFSSLLVVLTSVLMMATLSLNVKADEEIIDLYPNEDINNLLGSYGNSNWVLDFAGYRYHTVSFMARFASNFKDIDDEDKVTWSAADVPGVSANAMGGIIHNDTERTVILSDGNRKAFTGVDNYIWATFDEEGRLYMIENNIHSIYMTEVSGKSYFRLSNESEIAEYEDAEEGEKPGNILYSRFRMVLNDDKETYKIEPLLPTNGKFENIDYVEGGDNPKSIIFDEDYDPNNLTLKPGWTTLHFSTWDRGGDNFNALIESLPELLSSQEERAILNYLNPAPFFVNLKEKDVNAGEPGINFVYSINSEPSVSMLTDQVEARHVNEKQSIKGTHTKVDYTIKIYDDSNELVETVEVFYDGTKYVPKKDTLEHLDTSVFGARYYATFESTQPELDNETSTVTGDTVVEEAIIDVGVLPIHFEGVNDVFMDEGLPVNLLDGIFAYDNANDLNDITSSLTYTIKNRDTGSDHFNIWNAKAGSYDVTVNAQYIYYAEKIDFNVDTEITVGEKSFTIPVNRINHNEDPFSYGKAGSLYTDPAKIDLDLFATQGDKWGIYMALVDASGTVVAMYDYDGAKMTFRDGRTKAIEGVQKKEPRMEWLGALNFEKGDKLLVSSTTTDGLYAFIKENFAPGIVVDGLGKSYLVEGEATYRLTVADITPPRVRVKSSTLTIYTDSSFKNAEEAALSNIEIFEEHGYSVTVPGANRMDITSEGEYNVRVIVVDSSGNEAEATFTLVVKEAKVSESEMDAIEEQLNDALDANGKLEEDLNKANDKIADLEKALEEKPEGTPMATVIAVAIVSVVVSIGASAALVFLRKP